MGLLKGGVKGEKDEEQRMNDEMGTGKGTMRNKKTIMRNSKWNTASVKGERWNFE